MIGDTSTFAMGPKLLDGEHAPERKEDKDHEDRQSHVDSGPT